MSPLASPFKREIEKEMIDANCTSRSLSLKDMPCLNCRLIEMGEMACYTERYLSKLLTGESQTPAVLESWDSERHPEVQSPFQV